MTVNREKPTSELYDSLQSAYTHFNISLFSGDLPDVVFTVQRQSGTLGYFIPDRWSSPNGTLCHEIAINPTHIGSSRVVEVLQTIVHEMVHCWQFCYGKPPTKGYHNKEWAYKMMEVGLHPSSTGKPGGDIVGKLMSDYVIDGGPFWIKSIELIKNESFTLPWICRLSNNRPFSQETTLDNAVDDDNLVKNKPLQIPESVDISEHATPEDFLFANYNELMPNDTFFSPSPRPKAKFKYSCSGCHLNIWAKPGVRVKCVQCDIELTSQ